MTAVAFASEAELQQRWCDGLRGPLRTEDGRAFRVLFPGVPGGGPGPDVRDAVIDLDGDEVHGDVEFHLRAASWHGHGHAADPAYAGVVLHVVAANDDTTPVTHHRSGRVIPLAVVPHPGREPLPAFAPPCSDQSAERTRAALQSLGMRRLQRKAAAARLQLHGRGAEGLLYVLLLETLGGPANRAPFREVAERVPLPALLDRAEAGPGRAATMAALLTQYADTARFSRRGLRPAAFPERRIAAAAGLVASLWPDKPSWPAALEAAALPRALRAPGIGGDMAAELAVNAVLPVAVGSGRWPEQAAAECFARLRAPAPYGRLRRMAEWLAPGDAAPFRDAASLQGGLLLHAEWCARGRCGRCPLSS